MLLKIFIIFLSCYLNNVLSNKIEIVIMLGCSDNIIQTHRVNEGINYIKESKESNMIYISGGIKNNLMTKVTEASLMLQQIETEKLNIPIIIDKKAQNTAENFMNLKTWIDNNSGNSYSFVVVTSDFHQNRASLLFNGIFNNIQPKWILSKSECDMCWKNEMIHVRNVNVDVQNALLL